MATWVLVGLGGAIGSVARHGVSKLVLAHWPAMRFPLGTTIVNVLGCCVIGLLAGLVATGRMPLRLPAREFVFVGIVGGFTTFSTFSLDIVTLMRAGDLTTALWTLAVQVVGGIGGVLVAMWLCERVQGL